MFKALLAHQVWWIMQEPESLSARVLKFVYTQNSDLLSTSVGCNSSQARRSLCEGRDMLKQGLIGRIEMGVRPMCVMKSGYHGTLS